MFAIELPEGFTQVKQLCCNLKYELGFSYNIEILSIIQKDDGAMFLRRYTNSCDTGANGRPCTLIKDVGFRIDKTVPVSRIDKNNWDNFVSLDELLEPSLVIESTNGTYVDQKALDFVKESVQ